MNYKDYLTIISPPDRVDNKIRLFKRACGNSIGKFPGMYAKAHISFDIIRDNIDQYSKKPLALKSFYELLDFKIRTIPSHQLKINGFNFFCHGPGLRTIYAAIDMDEETENWFNTVKQALRINKKLKPHITVTRSIPIEFFNILWPYFQNTEYIDTFEADSLLILEKESGNPFDHYREYKKLPFGKKSLLF